MYNIILLIIVFLPIIANIYIKSSYSKYKRIDTKSNKTGKEVAREILDNNGLNNVSIVSVQGNLTDHYDPINKILSLSSDIYSNNSIASVAVAAHEVGHAIQDKENYLLMSIRTKIVPIVNFTSRLSTIFILIGLFSELINLYYIGILLLSGGLIFQLITLPVEFDASNRAKKQLTKLNIISPKEKKNVSKILGAAAFTYVAGFLATVLQIIRLLSLGRRNN